MASKKPKVKQDISKIDFTNALPNLYNESPFVEHNRTFQNITSDFLIKTFKKTISLNILKPLKKLFIKRSAISKVEIT